MKLIKASHNIISQIDGEKILKEIELVARTCYKSEDKIEYEDWILTNEEGDKKAINNYYAKSARILIPNLISSRHEEMLEFGGNINIEFICDRDISHELVGQESTRYCKYVKDWYDYSKDEHIQFIIPSWCDYDEEIWDEKRIHFYTHHHTTKTSNQDIDVSNSNWLLAIFNSEMAYNNMIKANCSHQQARSVLPSSLKTEINIYANIREWRHILKLRTSDAVHPDMQYLMRPLLKELQQRVPILFDDITY